MRGEILPGGKIYRGIFFPEDFAEKRGGAVSPGGKPAVRKECGMEMGNNPMVGATVAVAVAVENASK